jgi:hypothetical protein
MFAGPASHAGGVLAVERALTFGVVAAREAGRKRARDVEQSDTVQLVPAEFGYDFDGHPFFTHGRYS